MNVLEFSLAIPDLWQQEAIRALQDGRDVVVDAPTGAGKTWVFELFVKEWRGRERQAIYTVPTRALANDKWSEWKSKGWDVGIATGDLAENLEAPVIVATLETQRERLLMGNGPAMLVVDEYQMMGDRKRGLNYEVAIALAPPETQLLLLSGSVANPVEITEWLRGLGRRVQFVQETVRPVPLDEMPVEMLPKVPSHLKAILVRSAAGALLGELTPLLLFAPQRGAAEKLAKKIAAALPQDDPVELPEAAQRAVGKQMMNLLKSRVAYHHSGLSYAARAGVIEPLAKAGQLRVIVATTGLAAGINFSVRSVLISDIYYNDGPYLRELESDELLQMFGRAGRRGLDDQGFVLTTQKSPRIMDGVAKRLIRVNEIDWPTLIRIMGRAVRAGEEPLPAAVKFCSQLFSKQKIRIGIEADAGESDPVRAKSPLNFGPHRDEVMDGTGRWAPPGSFERGRRSLAGCWVFVKDRWRLALRSATLVDELGRGNLVKFPREAGRGFFYGKEFGVGNFIGDVVRLTVAMRKSLSLPKSEADMTRQEFDERVLPILRERQELGEVSGTKRRGDRLVAQVEFGDHQMEVTIDANGKALIDPPSRRVAVEVETGYEGFEPPAGSAAFAWRQLGLVDSGGKPTRRGQVFARFNGGEGLMVAAALEDASYPLDELIWHLGNLRGGYRFADEGDGGGSVRLGSCARSLFGMVDHPGYLELGLCPNYGEGTAEAIQDVLANGRKVADLTTVELRAGDIERAIVEWLSLLRHVVHARELQWGRWVALQRACGKYLNLYAGDERRNSVGALPQTTLNRRVRQRFGFRDFQS